MSTEDNKANVRRFTEEGVNQGNVAVFDELCASNWVYHDPSFPNVRTLEEYHLNFSGREKHIIWLNLFCSDRDGYHCEKEGTISVQVTTGQEAANCNSFARSSMRVAKLGNVFV
jgi:hypothetical protein